MYEVPEKTAQKNMKIVPISYQEGAQKRNIFFPLFSAGDTRLQAGQGSASSGPKESLAKEAFFSALPKRTQETLLRLTQGGVTGSEGETKSLWLPKEHQERFVFFGWGEKAKWTERKNPLVARRYVAYAKSDRVNDFATPFGKTIGLPSREGARVFAANAILAQFDFNKYKERPKEGWPEVDNIFLASEKNDIPEIKEGIKEGIIVGEETNLCRDLANTPGGDMTPEKLAQSAKDSAKKYGIGVKILEEKEIRKLGMGGIIGVAQGSEEKPKLIVLEYLRGPKWQKPLVLVGKGVTFDTGGLNLKPDHGIYEMHMDMSGGAAVIHGIAAIARLKLPVNVVGLIPAVENMPSGSSYRPGDILKTMSGKTIEVLNTDAEGRVILSDALYYGATKYNPGFMMDFATLTGSAHVALGNYVSALFTNREKFTDMLEDVGKKSGDYVWRMPLWDEYFSDIKGTFGDVANSGKGDRYGGAIQGAKFLEQFVKNTPWAHLDISPRMTTTEGEYLSKGASGVGVRYIVELAKSYPALL